jgi:DNA-directed RNA polymerase specialized sigma24 family protein
MGSNSQSETTAHKKWDLNQGSFDRLLAWLHSDREKAGKRYEEIRRRLIKIFACRGCYEAEDLADETINRVARKAEEIVETYSGDPALYFYGVANRVRMEYLRKKPAPPPPPPPPPSLPQPGEEEREYECLDRCMQQLTSSNRELVLQYYQEEREAKIENRKRLSQQLGIGINALRLRAFRIRETLQQCVQNCLGQTASE